MVKKRLESLQWEEDQDNDILWKEIRALTIKSLRRVQSPEAIKKICFEVITAVWWLLLVHVDEWVLATRKPKRKVYEPIQHTEDDRWKNSATIGKDWNSERWLENAPRWYVYYDTDWSLLGTIYESSREKWYEVFLKREIVDNPSGAKLIIEEMKQKLKKIHSKEKHKNPK